MILAHRHNWAGTTSGYKCLDCDAKIAPAEIAANVAPATTTMSPWEYWERKLNK